MKRLMKGKWQWFVICLAIMLVITGCNSNETSSNDKKEEATSGEKSMSIGITRTPVSFNPLDRADWSQFYISSVMFNPLMEMNEEFEFVPRLADSIETTDNQTFTAHLNKAAKWTDGKPVTADDVLFSLEMITHPKFSSLLTSQFQVLEGLEKGGKYTGGSFVDFPGAKKVDENTITFKTQTPIDPNVFNEKIAANLKALPKHVLGSVSPETLQQNPFMQKPTVSYGAYKFVEFQNNQFVALEANKEYFKGAPKVNKLFFKIMPVANLVAQLQNGDIDMNFPEIGSLSLQDHETVKRMEHIKTEDGAPVNYKLIGFNTKTLDVKVRQAIAYGINREGIVKDLLKGAGEVSTGPYSPAHPYYYKENNKKYPFDPEKAKELLKEAKWDSSKTINYIVPIGNQELEKAGDLIAANLKEVGINVQVQKSDIPGMIQKLKKGEFDLYSITFSFLLDPDVSYVYQSGASNNFTYISNAKMDELLSEGLRETDSKVRKVIYDEYQEVHLEQLPDLSLYADYRLRAVNKRVIVGGPKDIGILINVHEWDVK
ncbi:ABC transporter substrate-binding protein [Neobacillus niacini]|uniref:ABC transporter substrate-binding protein n=1 Tax=Neobacillus niacini TaxID=86668 RepID=UPI003000C95F